MDSSFVAYDPWSDMAKRVPPGRAGDMTFPSFIAHADLNWARPTGNVPLHPHLTAHFLVAHLTFAMLGCYLLVYSTVKDLAKLASLFMVGQDERKNALRRRGSKEERWQYRYCFYYLLFQFNSVEEIKSKNNAESVLPESN